VRIRYVSDRKDEIANFNREENLRPFPPNEPGYSTLYGLRQDAETINSIIEARLRRHCGRARTWTKERELFDLICFGIFNNIYAEMAFDHRVAEEQKKRLEEHERLRVGRPLQLAA